MRNLFEVDPVIWTLDDPRIRSMEAREISQAQFLTLIKPEDPFEMQAGRLVYLSEETMKERQKNYRASIKASFKLTGGLAGMVVYDARDKFLQVFPELAKSMEEAVAVISKDKCTSCAKNKYTNSLMQVLAGLPKGNRDLSPLSFLDKDMPYALKWLNGEQFEVADEHIGLPPFIQDRNKIPFRELPSGAPVVGEERTIGRKQCIDCAKKHMAQALILLREAEKGYPEHVELALQHMQKAETDVPDDKKEAFAALLKDVKKELDALDLKTIHNIAEVRRRVEEYLKDPSDPAAVSIWVAIGHMAEAEDECLNDYPILAEDIRRERLMMMQDPKYSPALEFILRKALTIAPKK